MSKLGFSYASGYTTRKVSQAPGGASSICFGEEPSSAKKTPIKDAEKDAEPKTEVAAAAVPDAAAKVEEPAADVTVTLEVLKLKALNLLSSASDTAPVKDVLTALIKGLEEVSPKPSANSAKVQQLAADAKTQLKGALAARGTHGIVSLGVKFRSMDDDSDKKLSYDELKKAVKEMRLDLSEAQMQGLFRELDEDCNGYVSFDELLLGLRGELNEARKKMVGMAFKVLDKTGDGKVTIDDLKGRYNAKLHPDVVLGTKSEEQVLSEFLDVFEARGQKDGVVDLQEFEKYYSLVSCSIDRDDYFELVIRNAWHISGGEGWAANTTCKRVLVLKEDGSEAVVEVTDDFDVDTKDLGAVKEKLISQGITGIKSIALYGLDVHEVPAAKDAKPPAAAASPAKPGDSTPTRAAAGTATRGRGQGNYNSSSIIFG